MLRYLLLAGVMATVMIAQSSAADDNTGKKGKDGKGDALDADKLQPGEFSGKLLSLPGTDGSFKVAVEYQNVDLKNVGKLTQDQQHLVNLQAQLATANARNVGRILQQINTQTARMLQDQNNAYKVSIATKDVEFHAADNLKIRLAEPASIYDDKGNIKKYTAAELKEMKGKDSKLPGYEGSAESLAVGQKVRVTLVHYVPHTPPADKKDPEKKDADAKEDADAKAADAKAADAKADDKKPADKKADGPPDHKLVVNMILIVDANTGKTDKGTGKPKKSQ